MLWLSIPVFPEVQKFLSHRKPAMMRKLYWRNCAIWRTRARTTRSSSFLRIPVMSNHWRIRSRVRPVLRVGQRSLAIFKEAVLRLRQIVYWLQGWVPRRWNCWCRASADIVSASKTTRSSPCRSRNASPCRAVHARLSTDSLTVWSSCLRVSYAV